MTRQEAREILKRHNKWRRGETSVFVAAAQVGKAIDTLTAPNEIAQSIREAALFGISFLDGTGYHMVYAFVSLTETSCLESMQDRTFMLFVAEALES